MSTVNSNIEIYKKLDERTKLYLTYSLSWIDYLTNNHLTLPIKDEDEQSITDFNIEDEEDIEIISFFLGMLSINGELNELFKAHDISLNDVTKFCNDKVKIYEDATEAECFDRIDLSLYFSELIKRISFNNSIPTNEIKLNEITPELILDYEFSSGQIETIEDLLNSEIALSENIYISEPFRAYQDYMTLTYRNLSNKHNVIPSEDDIKEIRVDEFIIKYDNGRVFLLLANGKEYKDVSVMDNTRKSIRIYNNTEVVRIHDRNISKEVFEEFIDTFTKSTIVGFSILDPKTKKIDTFHTFKEEMFSDEETSNLFNKEKNKTALEKLGTDVTNQRFIKNPAVGRDKELNEIETILLYPEKDRSIIITGPGGTGKSALIKGLCYRIQNGTVNKKLNGLRIINIDITDCVAGTKYAGVLEEKLKSILEEAKKDKNIIICIEEIHRAMGAGKTEGDDNTIAQILKQYLDYGDIRIIGTTTDEEYDEYIEVDTAFKSRFEKIKIKEPSEEVLYGIIDDLIESYNRLEDAPSLNMDSDKRDLLIKKLIEGTRSNCRHYQDRENNPRLLINIIKRAYAIANFEGSEYVTLEHVLAAYQANPRLYEASRTFNANMISRALNIEIKQKEKSNIIEFKLRKK